MVNAMRISLIAFAFMVAVAPAAMAAECSAPATRLSIVWPKNGTVIKGGKFWLRMGLRGMGVAPAGVQVPGTGHHHVIVDSELPPMDEPIPTDANHLHFGKGQTEARIELPKGEHTLQLLLGDAGHVPNTPPLTSEKITIVVK